MRGWLAALMVLGLGTAADAQVRMQQPMAAGRPAAGAVAAGLVDPAALLQSRVTALGRRVRGLEGRVSTLEELLRKTQAQTSFTCIDPTTSRNGAGATENCSPYACNYMDGRCRTRAGSSDQCAPGYLWIEGDHCQAVPPSSPD
jgi:hypothetical protein